MCLVILDVNLAPRVLLTPDDPDFSGLRWALIGKKRPNAILAYGGELTNEYQKNRELIRALVILDRAGRARSFADADIAAAADEIGKSGLITSNDHHILALARVSGARILCSEDGNLRTDFRKKELLDGPRGKLYSKAAHKQVLSHNC